MNRRFKTGALAAFLVSSLPGAAAAQEINHILSGRVLLLLALLCVPVIATLALIMAALKRPGSAVLWSLRGFAVLDLLLGLPKHGAGNSFFLLLGGFGLFASVLRHPDHPERHPDEDA